MNHAQNPNLPTSMVSNWDKTFPKSNKVNHKKITFKNRYGITLVADMYAPKNATGALPAIAISAPFGAVKEQSSGIYAQAYGKDGQFYKFYKSPPMQTARGQAWDTAARFREYPAYTRRFHAQALLHYPLWWRRFFGWVR